MERGNLYSEVLAETGAGVSRFMTALMNLGFNIPSSSYEVFTPAATTKIQPCPSPTPTASVPVSPTARLTSSPNPYGYSNPKLPEMWL